ncbi:MAG: hypothetical protein SFV81_19485 [Pirellulaceae bacterium]|nr:hypothetical protein [Pirellulaceae bacterium]
MRRRRTGQASSLDLFLDTICNTFGGIMFLAILLSVLVQIRSKEPKPVEPSKVPMTAAEAREVSNQLATLTTAYDRLTDLLVELRKKQPLPEDQTIQQLGKESEQAQKVLDEATQQQVETAKQLAQQIQTNAEILQSMEECREQLIAERAALEKDTMALDEALSDQMETLKLPKIATSFKSKVFFLMRYHKVYSLANIPGPISDNSDLNDADVTIKHLSPEAFTAAPKPAHGWSTTNAELDSYMRACSPSVHVFTVIVWPDSFAEFAAMKEKMIQLGFQYDLQPHPDEPSVPFGRGSGASRVQ